MRVPECLPGRRDEWAYVNLVIATFVFLPVLQRIAQWQGLNDSHNIGAIIPLLLLCPIFLYIRRSRRRLKRSQYPLISIVWGLGFGYAFVVSVAHGAILSGLYAGGQFVLPILIGYWLLTRPESAETCYKRLARVLLICGSLAGAYGIYQFVFAPPWDTAWMQQQGFASFGDPVPYGIRVFSVMKDPGTFALLLGAIIILNLPFLSIRDWQGLVLLLLNLIGLALTLVRSSWLIVLIGVVIYGILSPRRYLFLANLALLALFSFGMIFALTQLLPNANVVDKLGGRFSTLSDLQDDISAADRTESSLATLTVALANPFGAGLGATGGASKLQSTFSLAVLGPPASVIDNGFVSRFFEMGALGFLAFVIACAFATLVTIRTYRLYSLAGDGKMLEITAGCLALEIVIFLLNFSGDNQQGVLALVYFIVVAIPMLNDPPVHAVPSRFRMQKSYRLLSLNTSASLENYE